MHSECQRNAFARTAEPVAGNRNSGCSAGSLPVTFTTWTIAALHLAPTPSRLRGALPCCRYRTRGVATVHTVGASKSTPALTAETLRKIGVQLRAQRERLGWTQDRAIALLPDALRVMRNTWSNWERGIRGPDREHARAIDRLFASSDNGYQAGALLELWWPDDPELLQKGDRRHPIFLSLPDAAMQPVSAYSLDGRWAGVWVYLDEAGEAVAILDNASLVQDAGGVHGTVVSRRLFGSFRRNQAEYEVSFRVDPHGLALGHWRAVEPTSSFMGVMLGYLRDDSHEFDAHWLGNYRGGVRNGRLRWYLHTPDTPAEALLADDALACDAARALVELLNPDRVNNQ
jgi:transcriptional regulator with XRE-family HTH domain